jgi:uncharacterized protein
MSDRKAAVAAYVDGFRRGDHRAILNRLTDDVTWYIAGHTTTHGKDGFEREIESDQFDGLPELTTDRLVEEADTVVAIGRGHSTHRTQGAFRFAFVTVFAFRGDLIERVESYVTPLGGG